MVGLVKILLLSSLITMQNLVAVSHIVWNRGMLVVRPLEWGNVPEPHDK